MEILYLLLICIFIVWPVSYCVGRYWWEPYLAAPWSEFRMMSAESMFHVIMFLMPDGHRNSIALYTMIRDYGIVAIDNDLSHLENICDGGLPAELNKVKRAVRERANSITGRDK